MPPAAMARAISAALVPRSVFLPKPYDPEEVCTLLGRLTGAPH